MSTLHELPGDIADMLPASWMGQRIPPYMWEPIAAYIMLGRIPGEFLQAVIANDLFEAVLRADHDNERSLRALVGFFKTAAPYGCRGSRELLHAWSERGGLRGHAALASPPAA
jgi:hypothetical protein